MTLALNFCLISILVIHGAISQPNSNIVPAQATGVCNLFCIQGYHCEVCESEGPKCVPDHLTTGQSCATVRCPAGSTCQQRNIQCFAAPCPQPGPRCVPNNNENGQGQTCATMRCPGGSTCQQDTIYCIRAPCPQPPPKCVPCGPPVASASPPADAQSASAAQSSGSAMNPCPIG